MVFGRCWPPWTLAPRVTDTMMTPAQSGAASENAGFTSRNGNFNWENMGNYGKMNEHYMMINHAQFEALCIVLPWNMLSLPRDMLYINVVLPGKGGSSRKNMILLKASNSYWENEQMCIYICIYILCLSRQLVGASSLTKNILYRIFFSVDTWRSKMLFILRRAICVSILKKHINHHEIFVNAVSLFNDWRSGLKKLWFHVEWGGFYFHQAHQTNVFYQETMLFFPEQHLQGGHCSRHPLQQHGAPGT